MNPNRLFKPWLILPPKVLAALLMLLALAALGVGVYTGFFATKGFESTTAVIARIEEDESFASADPGDKQYTTYVTYTVDGKEYTEDLGSYAPGYTVGKEVKVKYDPADPATVRDASLGFSLYFILIGAALIAVSVFTMVKNGRQRSEVKADKAAGGESQPLFRPSHKLSEEREVYFLTDQGTAKGTCHLEDAGRNLLYEAVCDKFSLVGDSLYTFKDREHGAEKQYSVGKTLTQSAFGSRRAWTASSGPTPSIGTRSPSPGSSTPAGRSTRRTKAASSPRCLPPGSSASGPGKSIWTPSF